MPKISYIVSTYNDTESLPCCLWSLRAQTDQDFEVIIADNSETMKMRTAIYDAAKAIFPRVRYVACSQPECFHAANLVAQEARGEFLCFPSDDSYYMPVFGEEMLRAASDADFVMCHMVYDGRCGQGGYRSIPQQPKRFWCDKTGFIIRRDKFPGFPNIVVKGNRMEMSADGEMAELLVSQGVSWKVIPDVLCVHN